MSDIDFIKQHSDDGEMVIKLSSVQAIRLSEDGYNADILLSDGNWVRTNQVFMFLKDKVNLL